ncbi:TniB family NTP-binding protein [Muricoccus vinaceus]|uniref:TniB family NTP-binding protein n=1 Tax=Muricoccus vinaceus TaxID=424704 RepID=A0ABV6IT60_9PROT
MRAILAALQVQGVSSRATEADLTRILVHHLREMGVRLLILDEAQHLTDSETGRFAYVTADWFKSLANSGIALVIAGTPEAALAYSLNEQLERRSMGSQKLSSFEWDGGDEGSHWITLLRGLLTKVPLDDASYLLCGDVPHRLHLATGGYLGRLVDFLSLVIMEAGKRGAYVVDRELLMAVEERRRNFQNPDWLNVFALVSLEGYEPPSRDTTRKTRIRKGKRRPRQQDIEHPEAA